MSKIRYPAVAGFFYPGIREALLKDIEELFKKGPGIPVPKFKRDRKILGIISPHAGYVYSGWIAAYGYYEVALDGLPDRVILIGPNHTGLGTAISVYPRGYWHTPLGKVEVDYEISGVIASYSDLITQDEDAHLQEHSIEVQIPFLQYLYKQFSVEFKIIPIVMMLQNINSVKILGESIKNVVSKDPSKYLIVASTDFTHYEPSNIARSKDEHAIKAILECNPEKLIEAVYKYDISMCGYGPVATLLYVARELGYCNPILLKYGNSGDVTGDYSNVVAYASFKIEAIKKA